METGGSDGLGKEIARILRKQYQVIILRKTKNKIRNTVNNLKIEGYQCDITDFNQIEGVFNKILQKHKRIDILINNAGIWIEGCLEENNSKQIEEAVKTNLLGQIFTTYKVLPIMKENH